jgi:phospholipid/cholesterol/gamma-HCH transport system substrate-binding protein
MKSRSVEITVGLFMLGAVAAFLMLALKVSGLSNFSTEQQGYKIKAIFEHIGNLKVRAKVSAGGVLIGRVTKISLNPKTFNAEVDMVVETDMNQLPIDSRASILTAGLLGDNYIGLSPGQDDSQFLKEGSVIDVASTEPALLLEKLVARLVSGVVESMNKKDHVPAPAPAPAVLDHAVIP